MNLKVDPQYFALGTCKVRINERRKCDEEIGKKTSKEGCGG